MPKQKPKPTKLPISMRQSFVICGRVEHVCPYADKKDQPVCVEHVMLSTPGGSVELSFAPARRFAVSPGEWLHVVVSDEPSDVAEILVMREKRVA